MMKGDLSQEAAEQMVPVVLSLVLGSKGGGSGGIRG